MANYFNQFPKAFFNGLASTDLRTRLDFKKSFLFDENVYFNYTIKNSDRPETIAADYYGDPYLSWLVLLTNKMFDSNYEFPLSDLNFSKYLDKKYEQQGSNMGKTGFEFAVSTIHPIYGYQKKVTMLSGDSKEVENINYYIIDEDTYYDYFANGEAYKSEVITGDNELVEYISERRYPLPTYFDVEQDNNEARRNIKLLRDTYVQRAVIELQSLMVK